MQFAVTVDASSKAWGAATIENQTPSKAVTDTFTSQSDNALCETNAEWLIMSLVPFTNFDTFTFTFTNIASPVMVPYSAPSHLSSSL